MSTPLPEVLSRLSILGNARANAAVYYAPLLDSDNEIIRMGAWCALLDRGEVAYEDYAKVIGLSTRAGIRRRAYDHFKRFFEYEFAHKAAAVPTDSEEAAEQLVMQAELSGDDAAHVAAQRALYLASGKTEALTNLIKLEEQIGGWRPALPVAIDAMIINPHEPMAALDLLHLTHESGQAELVDAVVSLFESNGLHPHPTLLYSAASKLLKGNFGGCLKALATLSTARVARPDVAGRLRTFAMMLTAEALEKMGDYRKAYTAYRDANALDHGKQIDLEEFPRMIAHAAGLPVPELPPDAHTNHFVMTGFPRSGTTLLENALAAHPMIETFEEIPALSSMQIYLDRVLPGLSASDDQVPVYVEARERYYQEIERHHRKAGAEVFVDKMPMRSADAGFEIKTFPAKRHIFSIRHPFDVVLSCFKQQFKPNIAMEHFRTFENAVKMYDFTMKQWFSVYSLEDDPRVQYVRYDMLVTDFEPTVRGVLTFLGVPWDDAVLGFAQAAANRKARTPSYQKVRKGLSIGIQTQWRNYGFLFQSEAARPLLPWVEKFGYHTE